MKLSRDNFVRKTPEEGSRQSDYITRNEDPKMNSNNYQLNFSRETQDDQDTGNFNTQRKKKTENSNSISKEITSGLSYLDISNRSIF